MRSLFDSHCLRIGAQGNGWKILTIHVVLQIKHLREPCARVGRFVPGTIRILRTQQELGAAVPGVTASVTWSKQSHHCPRGLRCGAGADPAVFWIFVRAASFSPSTI